jgi:hypothetical protein
MKKMGIPTSQRGHRSKSVQLTDIGSHERACVPVAAQEDGESIKDQHDGERDELWVSLHPRRWGPTYPEVRQVWLERSLVWEVVTTDALNLQSVVESNVTE